MELCRRDSECGASYVEGFDDYGFAIFCEGHEQDSERCHRYSRMNEDEQLLLQWEKVMSQQDWKEMHGCPSVKIQKMIRQGVPAKVRPILWTKLLDADTLSTTSNFDYKNELATVREQLVDYGVSEFGGSETVSYLYELESNDITPEPNHLTFDCLRQILLDLDRSYPTHKMFMCGRAEGVEGRAALFRILATYARYNKEVGYCQGMSYLGGILLMVMDDEELAFWGLVSMLERFKYLRGYYDNLMERIQRHGMVFTKLLKQRAPAIHRHLEELSITPMMFATPWFLSLYTSLGCWDTVLAIWDLFMLDGVVTIFRVGLGIIDVMEECILATADISQLLPRLLHPSHRCTSFLTLMPAVYDIHLEDWEVAKLEAVIIEESGIVKQPSRRRHSKRHVPQAEPECKRRRIDSETPQTPKSVPGTSFFQRFVNMFTPREQREKLKSTQAVSTSKLERRPSLRRHQSPYARHRTPSRVPFVDVVNNNRCPQPLYLDTTTADNCHLSSSPRRKMSRRQRLIEEGENIPCRRRSPRLQQTSAPLRDLNTPSDKQLVGSAAQVQYSFKHFTTPKPLRRSQLNPSEREAKENVQDSKPAPGFSPLEMKPMFSCKTQ